MEASGTDSVQVAANDEKILSAATAGGTVARHVSDVMALSLLNAEAPMVSSVGGRVSSVSAVQL